MPVDVHTGSFVCTLIYITKYDNYEADTNISVCVKYQYIAIFSLFYLMSTHHVHLPLFVFLGDANSKLIDYTQVSGKCVFEIDS